MSDITGKRPVMWGPSIVGFDSYHYKYASGHEGDICLTGFSSRKPDISIYLYCLASPHRKLLAKVGKHKMSKARLYVRRLSDVDMKVVRKLIEGSISEFRKLYG